MNNFQVVHRRDDWINFNFYANVVNGSITPLVSVKKKFFLKKKKKNGNECSSLSIAWRSRFYWFDLTEIQSERIWELIGRHVTGRSQWEAVGWIKFDNSSAIHSIGHLLGTDRRVIISSIDWWRFHRYTIRRNAVECEKPNPSFVRCVLLTRNRRITRQFFTFSTMAVLTNSTFAYFQV